ncbi:MAG: hypothetical protein JWO13_457 [Acidobacteriales bacterium]|nr:hypothetical protein [Terriglobales bacterium]
MARELFNSPEKRWIREHFWLPALLDFKTRSQFDLPFKYLTFAGPEGRDVEFFCKTHSVFALQNISVWEKNDENAKALISKFGLELRVKQGEAFDLSSTDREASFFPYSAINLDFTNGFFNLKKNRISPHKLELIQNIVEHQQHHASNFLLLLAFNTSPDVDTATGKSFVHKMAFDVATRFGSTRALFNLTRNSNKTYDKVLSDLLPAAVITVGGEHTFDTRCLGKAVYRPYGVRKSAMLCLVFEFVYDNPPLSQSSFFRAQRMEDTTRKRQEESLALELIDVNQTRRIKRKGISISKHARARYRKLFPSTSSKSIL